MLAEKIDAPGGNRMPRCAGVFALALPLLLGSSIIARAQDDPQDKLGMRIFNQSCRVCHTKPQIISPQYAPVLSMNTLGGKADLITEVISNGTPRMPGFKYQYKPEEIAAIAAYIKTIPVPAAAAMPAPGKSNASRGAD
jgi:mono/diheme cytochrome c family protein